MRKDAKHVVMYSGGICSWMAAKRVADQHGTDNLILLYADTGIEDDDLYRFLEQGAENVGGQLVQIADGRTPWEVFRDVKFIGNTRADPCSRILKREICDQWLVDNCNPDDTVVYVGMDWTEIERFTRMAPNKLPWVYKAPMMEPPYYTKQQMIEVCRFEGIEPPRLYAMGFPHNNCGGFCVKAGRSQFKLLLEKLPDVYKEHEREEEKMREYLGKDVSILRDRRGGTLKPLTLANFRGMVEAEDVGQRDMFEWGGCSCFTED